jgi:pyruvate dehydrogenase E1 component beta subunit
VREGKDVTIVSLFDRRRHGAGSGRDAGGEGIEAEVIDLRTLRPLDPTRCSPRGQRRPTACVTVEEGWPVCSIALEIIASGAWRTASTISTRRSLRVHGEDVPLPYAANLEKGRADPPVPPFPV